ncbi:MAG TPA: protein kinase [Holophaga sp.]|nr:protein kinase [Holophaga sp.]
MFEKLGRYEIKSLLGRGAMGEVYLALDPTIGREVAIKTILPSSTNPEEARRRFAREAQAAGVLNHPNIVTIYEFGEDQGVLFIAMERVKGEDLEELIRRQGLAHGEVLEVLAQVCDGLEFAHRSGVIHRDIKPSNVRVLRDGRRLGVKVMDFGVARIHGSDMTATGTVVGTVSYMAPEYIQTGKPDGRSDLFAVGVMLYECISGRKPFAGDTAPTILYRIIHEAPDPIDLTRLDGISPAIRSVLDQALAKDPAKRFATADDLARALRAAKDPTWQGAVDATIRLGERSSSSSAPCPPPAVPSPVPVRAGAKPAPLKIAMLGGGALLILVLMAGGGYLLWRRHVPGAAVEAPKALASPSGAAPVAAESREPNASNPLKPEPPSERRKSPEKVNAPHPAPSTSAQAPTPLPPPEKLRSMPAHERQSLSGISLSEAINLADTDPKRALEGFRAAIAANPGNANAYAWMIAILYEQGRYGEIPAVMAKARENGIGRARLLANIRFRMAMQNDRLNHRIPRNAGDMGEE